MSEKQSNNQKELPSPKLALDKQIEIIKAFAVIYGTTGKGSSYKDVASKVGANANNVSGSLKFWKDIGIIISDDSGYVPSQALIDFNQKIQWGDEDSAWKVFYDAMVNTWFLNELKIKFQLKPKISVDELIKSLGMASGIQNKDSNTTKSIQMLIQLLELGKIIEKDSDGNYAIRSDSTNKSKKIVIEESKDMIQVSIDNEIYAIDVDKIKEFVLTNGKKISNIVQKVD